MRAAVKKVARLFPTAIVSGRCRSKVYIEIPLQDIYIRCIDASSANYSILVVCRYTNL